MYDVLDLEGKVIRKLINASVQKNSSKLNK